MGFNLREWDFKNRGRRECTELTFPLLFQLKSAAFKSGKAGFILCGIQPAELDMWEWDFKYSRRVANAPLLFQMSFASTATTIVSGAIAERFNFNAYCIFSLLNTIVYCVPAGWLWGSHGFLSQAGVVDIAGSGGVHLVGGASAFVGVCLRRAHANCLSSSFAMCKLG